MWATTMLSSTLSLVILSLLGAGGWVGLTSAAAGIGTESTAALSVEGPRFSATVRRNTECCPKTLVLTVQKDQEESAAMSMEGRLQTLTGLQLVGQHRLLVTGELRYGGTGLWIADLETLSQETEIWTYGYSVSPSGRRLVYQTHYPRMVPPEGRRSIFLLYDLTRPPAGNRPGSRSDWPEPNLGTPIFPEENVEQRSWDIHAAERRYSLISPFLWSKDEMTVLFLVAEHGEVGTLKTRGSHIVRVDLSEQAEVIDVRREPLTLENLHLPQATVPHVELEDRELVVHLESLDWAEELGPAWVVGQTALPGTELGSKVWIRIPGTAPTQRGEADLPSAP